jgi:hypothetical protein
MLVGGTFITRRTRCVERTTQVEHLPPMAMEPNPRNITMTIQIEGRTLSPRQYRFLFDDLVKAIGSDDEARMRRHYHEHGEAEIESQWRRC